MSARDIGIGELKSLLDYNKETGVFEWRPGTPREGKGVGSMHPNGMLHVSINKKRYPAHRLAWFYVHGAWPQQFLVPLNGNYLDLRIANWKEASASDVALAANRKQSPSGYRGVSLDRGRKKWVATIRINGTQKCLGRFDTPEAASEAFETARLKRPKGVSWSDQQREQAKEYARYRSLWNRMLRAHANMSTWTSFEEFRATVESTWKPFGEVVSDRETEPVGPNNWKWRTSLYSQFDTTTSEGKTAYERAYRHRNPFVKKDRDLRKTFGISVAEFHAMRDAQGGVCAACGRPEKEKRSGRVRELAVDHCHRTGAIRGLLCGNCNRGIGKFEDNPDLLRKAADYLERFAAKTSVKCVPTQDPPST